jgi:hypothetical protein
MSAKKPKLQRRSPISRTPLSTVEEFVRGSDPAYIRQSQTTELARIAQEEKRWKKNKILADRRRSRFTMDLSRYAEYNLMERVDALCAERSIPPSNFIALCIQLGLQGVENGSLNLDDYAVSYDANNKKFDRALSLEKE